jgi:hypothetical protein
MRGTRTLRPRSLMGIYDAAFEISVSSPAVVALAWLGAAPIAILGVFLFYVGAEGVPIFGDVWLLGLACGLATAWRAVPSGAIARLVLDHLSGKAPDGRAAFAAALGRAPTLMAGGALVLWTLAISLPFLLLPMLFWGGVCLAGPLIMERVCAPWSVGGASRRLLGERTAVAGGLTLMWVLAVAILALNLAALSALLLFLGRSLGHVDVGYLAVLLSPDNPAFVPALMAVAFLVLEPVRQVSLALMYADARIRAEGLDLRAALDALPAPGGRGSRRTGSHRAAAGLVLVLAGAGLQPAMANTPEALAPMRQDVEVIRDGLPPGEAAAMDRLLRRVDADLEAGRTESARRRLEGAIAEAEASPQGLETPEEARRRVEAILDRPEFRRVDRRSARRVEQREFSWFDRLLDWLDRPQRRNRRAGGGAGVEGLADLGRIFWGLLLVVLAALVVWWVVRAFAARTLSEAEPDADGDPAGGFGAARKGVLGLDPLSRTPDAWLAEADRLAAEGRYREALRAAYLALLARLHRARAIDYQPTRTNWDHARAFRGPEDARQTFVDLTRSFDRAWYGARGVAPEDYRRVRDGALTLGRPDEAAHG